MRDQHLLAEMLAVAGGNYFGRDSGEITVVGSILRIED
jgi:hypothetical protein